MRISVVGMSHVEALRRALPSGHARIEIVNVNQKGPMVRFVPGGEWLDARKAVKPRFRMAMKARGGHFVSMIGGNVHNMIGLIEHPCRYDFLSPSAGSVAIAADRELVPYDAMRAFLEMRIAPALAWIAALAPLFPGRRIHIGSPPPVPSTEHIHRFPSLIADQLNRGVTPAAIRLKLFDLKGEIERAGCAAIGVDWVPPPAAAVDEAGFLKPEYWNNDPTHGNEAYGRLLLRQIEEALP